MSRQTVSLRSIDCDSYFPGYRPRLFFVPPLRSRPHVLHCLSEALVTVVCVCVCVLWFIYMRLRPMLSCRRGSDGGDGAPVVHDSTTHSVRKVIFTMNRIFPVAVPKRFGSTHRSRGSSRAMCNFAIHLQD